MHRLVSPALLAFLLLGTAVAQGGSTQSQPLPRENNPPPRSSTGEPPRSSNESSSRDTIIDLSPPPNDAKQHPNSTAASDEESDVQEFHPYDPHRAQKDVEVGDFYLKQRNYRAAESRYREALLYKPNDAEATYRLAQSLEKQGQLEEARSHYQNYLKILPYGAFASEARKALERLKEKPVEPAKSSAQNKPPKR